MTFDSDQAARDAVLVRRLGDSVTYTAVGSGPKSIKGIFQRPSRPSELGPRSMNASQPMITVVRADVPALRSHDQFSINDVEYRVTDPGIDEGECALVRLEEI